MNPKVVPSAQKIKEKAQAHKELVLNKNEEKVSRMNEEEIIAWLKQKGMPTFGTKGERVDRVRKAFGLPPASEPSKDKLLKEIEKIKQKREDRRAEMHQIRKDKFDREHENEIMGRKGDIDFARMIEAVKHNVPLLAEHSPSTAMKLCVCVRKRPIFPKELGEGENDCLSVANPEVKVFDCKFKVDGITKFVDTQAFKFDNAFNENESTETIYECTVRPVMEEIFNEGMVTLCAYGQTGSGKTYTMRALQQIAIAQLYSLINTRYRGSKVYVTFFEIYGGRCFDLMNEKAKVQILEDKNNNVVIQNLVEKEVTSEKELLDAILFAFDQRTTYATTSNDTSSRSHAVCQVIVRQENSMGKLIVVDLAGSERAQDTTSNNRQRRLEGAEINKSLLALKECIRAMDQGSVHVPFRVSKLTMALRDSFVSKTFKNRVVMIACLCPSSSSADHTLNTLRYADRLKGKKLNIAYNYGQKDQIEEALVKRVATQEMPALGFRKKEPDGLELYDNAQFKKSPSLSQEPKQPKKILENFMKSINETDPKPQNLESVREILPENPLKPKPKQDQLKKILADEPETRSPISKIPLVKSPPKELTNKNQPSKQKPLKPSENPPNNPENNSKKLYKQDLNLLRQTIHDQLDETPEQHAQNLNSDEYLTFHDKVGDIIEIHDDLLALHLNVIREDAQLLSQESEIIAEAQAQSLEHDVEKYVDGLEDIVKKKLYLYKQLSNKIKKFKLALKEEEEYSRKLKGPLYY